MDGVIGLIRESQDGDIQDLHSIYSHHVLNGTASWEWEPPCFDEVAKRREGLVKDGFPYLVYERGGQILGFAYGGPFRTRRGYRYTIEDSIYVAPNAQGQGIGKALLAELIAHATTKGFRQMVAVIGDAANAPSIALHQSLGFVECGRMTNTGLKFGQWLDSVFMQRALGEGAASLPPQESP